MMEGQTDMQELLKLKSGSDVRGIAMETLGKPITLTGDIAEKLGYCFTMWLAEQLGKAPNQLRIAVGRDSRITGPELACRTLTGIALAGATALYCGLCTTPAMFMTTVTPGVETDGAIMVTASHHPYDRNGLKFFADKGGLSEKDIVTLLQAAQQQKMPTGDVAPPRDMPFLQTYCNGLTELVQKQLGEIEKPFAGFHVVVDAGNGAGGFYADWLESLGADISGSLYLQPDGMFPNHRPNPEDETAMAAVGKATGNSHADIGVIFDADCDRAAVVGSSGKAINKDRLIALSAAMILQEEPGATVVTDSVTSPALTAFIESLGGRHCRFKRGYRNVIDEAIRLNEAGINCPLAIETSGHAALRENYFLDDGMYLATRILAAVVKSRQSGGDLLALIETLQEPEEDVELRLQVTAADFRQAGFHALTQLEKEAHGHSDWLLSTDSPEGVRIQFDVMGGRKNAFAIARMSVHDPVMVVNIQSNVLGGQRQIQQALYQVFSNCDGIEAEPLQG